MFGGAVQRVELRSTEKAQTFAMASMAGRLATPVKPRASRAQVATWRTCVNKHAEELAPLYFVLHQASMLC